MNAVEFIKQYGWEMSKAFLNNWSILSKDYGFEVEDLKQLVDAWELVNKWNGVDAINELIAWEMENHSNGGNRNKELTNKKVIDRLKKSIELVESVK